MNAPDYIGNAISFYNIRKSDGIPGIPDEKETYDKLTVVMICLNTIHPYFFMKASMPLT